jgi:hypothetical protein
MDGLPTSGPAYDNIFTPRYRFFSRVIVFGNSLPGR